MRAGFCLLKDGIVLSGLLVSLCLAFPLSAQTGYLPPNPIVPPRIASPAMPPPGLSLPVVTPPSAVGVEGIGDTKESSAKGSAGKAQALPDSLNEMASPQALLSALGGTGTDSGGLDALTALLGGGSPSLGNAGSGGTNAPDTAALNKILALLEAQEAERVKKAPSAQAEKGSSGQGRKISSGGELLRFTVNNYDLAATATSLVSSILAKDGSFLITGGRTYLSSGKERRETFYLLCQKSGTSSYRLFADVSQDAPNEYSYIYQLVRKTPLTGTLTGDLLVFRNADPAWNLDLVIRLIYPTVSVPSGR
jgi:hypothetical protein